METATAAVPTTGPEEDDNLDAMTIAEPEMEIEVQGSEAEPEHPDDIPDVEEYPEDVSNDTIEERQPVLLPGTAPIVDPNLQMARAAMQPVFYLDNRVGNCVDAVRPAFAYMAYNLCRTIYKIWPSTTAWLTLPYETLQERFNTGSRYDALGSWPASLCATDPETNISKEISDEEVRASYAEVRGNIKKSNKH